MGYPTNSLALTLEQIDNLAVSIKNYASSAIVKLGSSVTSSYIFDMHIRAKDSVNALVSLSAEPGLAAYAKTIKNDANLDVVAEFNAMLSALNNLVTQIETVFPTDGTYLLAQEWGANGPTDRVFSSVQTASLIPYLTVIVNSIE